MLKRRISKKQRRRSKEEIKENIKEETEPKNNMAEKKSIQNNQSIDALTEEKIVTDYLKNGELPEYYITKKEAQREGWVAKEGNLCDVLPEEQSAVTSLLTEKKLFL